MKRDKETTNFIYTDITILAVKNPITTLNDQYKVKKKRMKCQICYTQSDKLFVDHCFRGTLSH